MGLLESLGNFLFGKTPDIFDENGRVRHKFTESKWEAWNNRLKKSPDYDWRKHSAKVLAEKPVSQPAPPKK